MRLSMFTIKDLKQALYGLSKAKGYSLTVIMTLGLTLGAPVAVFNLASQILLAPLPYPDSDQLYYLHGDVVSANGQRTPALPVAASEAGYMLQPDGQADRALLGYNQDIELSLPQLPKMDIGYATPELFELLDVPMGVGRPFSATEGLNHYAAVTIISYRTWVEQFSKRADVLGQQVRFGDKSFRIIGVTAREFQEPEILTPGQHTDLWLPWDFVQIPVSDRNSWSKLWGKHAMLVKVQPQADPAAILFSYNRLFNQNFAADSNTPEEFKGSRIDTKLTSLQQQIQQDSQQKLLMLLLGGALLALVALVNISNLLLARLAAQSKQLAIHVALGAQPAAMLRLALSEWLPILALATLVGAGILYGLQQFFRQLPPGLLPRLDELTLQPASLVLFVLLPLVISAVLALWLCRKLDYRRLHQYVSYGGKGGAMQLPAQSLKLMIAIQTLFATLVLVFALQLLQHALTQLWQPVGLDIEQRYHATLNLGELETIPRPQRREELLAIRALLEQEPDISLVSIANLLPLANYGDFQWYSEITDSTPDGPIYSVSGSLVDEHYLPVLGARLHSGRNFTAGEVRQQQPKVIINRTLASALQRGDPQRPLPKLYWSSYNAEQAFEIVGVINDWQLPGLTEPPRALFSIRFEGLASLIIQLEADAVVDKKSLNQRIAKVNPAYKVMELRSLRQNYDQRLMLDRLTAICTGALSLTVLLLCTIGIYGVLSYSVQLRRFELGVRMAIGASPFTILRQLLSENLKPVVAGLALAALLLAALWLGLQQTTLLVELSVGGFALLFMLIMLLTVLTSLLSVWGIIRKPAAFALRGQ